MGVEKFALCIGGAANLTKGLGHRIERIDVVAGQAVAALRALPLDKRPLARKVDGNIDFPLTLENFAGTMNFVIFPMYFLSTAL